MIYLSPLLFVAPLPSPCPSRHAPAYNYAHTPTAQIYILLLSRIFPKEKDSLKTGRPFGCRGVTYL